MKLNQMTENQFKKYQLKKIKILFEKLDRELYKLPNKNIDEFNNFHNAEASLPYCIRWGLQATEELLEVIK